MRANPVLLQRKYARVIALFAEIEDVKLLRIKKKKQSLFYVDVYYNCR